MTTSRAAPPRRGASLGVRLGLLTALSVTGVMAALSGSQLALELHAERQVRQALLRDSLAPLVRDLRNAASYGAVADAMKRFHASYVDQGNAHHHLTLVARDGAVLLSTRGATGVEPRSVLAAEVELVVLALGEAPLILRVTEDGTEMAQTTLRRWRGWALHVAVTAALALGFLFVVIRREVTGPVDRLIRGVEKMELGYWDDMPDPKGAWELRWLAWRFRSLGQELSRTVEHLVAAQQRAYVVERSTTIDSEGAADTLPLPLRQPEGPDPTAAAARLEQQLHALREANPAGAGTRALARAAWDHHARQAARLGLYALRNRLEDAALAVLDAPGFREIKQRLQAERSRLDELIQARTGELLAGLRDRDLPVAHLRHRLKHPAGVWKKMRQKKLDFEQVHDLVALRIVVPTETDCYQTLGVVHDLYDPIVGRFKDYIASPKPNGYRGLHASVRDPAGAVFEVQIRSIAMHQQAEQGSAAHADYGETTAAATVDRPASVMTRVLGWIRSLRGGARSA